MESLLKQVLVANECHKIALDRYTNKLQSELNAVNKLIAAVEDISDENLQEDPGDKWCLHVDGAFKPNETTDLTETLDERSPFFVDAARRERYTKSLAPSPFSASERKYLEKAVMKESKRLVATRAQQTGQNAIVASSLENETFLKSIEGINWASVARDVSASNNPVGKRTAQECKVRWLGLQRPIFFTGPWTDGEEKRLHDLVESRRESGRFDWEEIARLLETNRTPLDCIKRFQASTRPIFRWTKPLDQRLLEAVEKYGSSNWALVAPSVSSEVSANQCQIRYERSVNPVIKRGRFTTEEDTLLMGAIEVHGSDWVKVAQAVPGRTNAQCRGRYTLYLTGGIVKAPWDPEEDTRLRAAVSKLGHRWEKVREEMGASRHQTQYATRYRILTRWDAQGKEDRSIIGRASPQLFHGGTTSDSATSEHVSARRSSTTDFEVSIPVASDSITDPTPSVNKASRSVHMRTSANDLASYAGLKGTGTKRGRKRKILDPGSRLDTTGRIKSQQKFKSTGTESSDPGAHTDASERADDENTGGTLKAADLVPAEKTNQTAETNLPAVGSGLQSSAAVAVMAELSDLTDEEDICSPNRRSMRGRGATSAAKRAVTRKSKPSIFTKDTCGMTTRSSARNMKP